MQLTKRLFVFHSIAYLFFSFVGADRRVRRSYYKHYFKKTKCKNCDMNESYIFDVCLSLSNMRADTSVRPYECMNKFFHTPKGFFLMSISLSGRKPHCRHV